MNTLSLHRIPGTSKAIALFCLLLLFTVNTVSQDEIMDEPKNWDSAGYLGVKIDALIVKNGTVNGLLQYIVAKANKAGAGKLGFKGVVLANPAFGEGRVNLRLNQVPLGVALMYLGNLSNSVLIERNGLCILYPMDMPQVNLVSVILEPSERVRKFLNLNNPDKPTRPATELRKLGFLFEDADILYLPDKNIFYAKLAPKEAELLQSLFTFIDRGYKLILDPEFKGEK